MKIKATDIIGIIGGGEGGSAPPQQRVVLRQTTGQSIISDTVTQLAFIDTDVIQNVGDFWNTTDPSQFTIPAGVETVIISITFSTNSAGSAADYSASVKKNGTEIVFERGSVSSYGGVTMSVLLDVEEGDILTPYIWSTSAFTTEPSKTSFAIVDVTNGGSGQAAVYAQNAQAAALAASNSATSAAASATSAGSSATIAQNASITATTAATSADGSKTAAQNSATAAATSASNAASSSTAASASATAASNSAVTASSAANAADTSATNAQNSATAAGTSATTAETHATNAATSATAANTSAVNAASAATAADGAKTAAQNSATAAAGSATTAATNASNASSSASAANTSAVNAASSATAADNSKTAAQNSATAAAGSATTASTQATNAGTSATSASNSALTAASHATSAGTSATNASNSATAAATSATTAATQATNASNSATTAQSNALIAQANSSTRGITPNANFDAGQASWYGNNSEAVPTTVFAASYQSSNNVATSSAGVRGDIYSAKSTITTSRKYRLRARIYSSGQAGPTYIGVQCLDNNGATIGANIGVLYWSTTALGTGWTDVVSNVITGEGAADGSGGWAGGFRAGTKQIRVFVYLNYNNTASQQMGIDYLYVEDVTESQNAADSATAASTSASNAAASASSAGTSATAASGHANTASTAAGTATTKASEAATSASNAQGYANTASSQASLAATSATAAAGSATAASNSASTASTQATNAGASATSASNSANTATTKAGEAASSASAAAGSAASASASASTAQTYSAIAASIGPGALNKNPSYGDYPSAAVGAVPTGWTVGAAGTGSGYRVDNGIGGYAWRLPAAAAAQTYAATTRSDSVLQTNGYYVIEADVVLNSGTLAGAGVLFRAINSSGATVQDLSLIFSSDPDQTGVAPGNGSAGRAYQFRKLVKITAAAAYGLTIYTMSHYSVFGSISAANDITWFKCLVRPATQAEIRDQTVLPSLESSVSTLSSTVATYDARLASYVTKVSAGSGSAELALYATDSGGATATNITLKADKIKLGSVTQPALEVSGGNVVFNGQLNVGATSGARVNITNNLIRVYDSAGTLRVRLGIW